MSEVIHYDRRSYKKYQFVCGRYYAEGVRGTTVLDDVTCPSCLDIVYYGRSTVTRTDGPGTPRSAETTGGTRQTADPVASPSHYTSGKVECIDAIDAALAHLTDGREAFYTAQVIKYVWRWKLKNGVEDLRKAKWYLERLIGVTA